MVLISIFSSCTWHGLTFFKKCFYDFSMIKERESLSGRSPLLCCSFRPERFRSGSIFLPFDPSTWWETHSAHGFSLFLSKTIPDPRLPSPGSPEAKSSGSASDFRPDQWQEREMIPHLLARWRYSQKLNWTFQTRFFQVEVCCHELGSNSTQQMALM